MNYKAVTWLCTCDVWVFCAWLTVTVVSPRRLEVFSSSWSLDLCLRHSSNVVIYPLKTDWVIWLLRTALVLTPSVASNQSLASRRSCGCREKSICLHWAQIVKFFECFGLFKPVLGCSTGLSLSSRYTERWTLCLLQGKTTLTYREDWFLFSAIDCTSPVIIRMHIGRCLCCRNW